MPQNYIGVDVSKEWIDVHYLPTGRSERIITTKQTLAKFAKGAKGAIVVLEASGGYERALTEALTRFKADFCLADARRARDFARAEGRLAKTDRVDAINLARMGRALALQPTPPSAPERVELADMVARRDDLVVMIGAERNRLGQSHDTWIKAQLASHINALVRQRKAVEARVAALIAAHEALAERSRQLQSVPGIGATIAAVLLARLPELGQLDRRKLAHLTGLAPLADESGKRHGRRRIWGGRAAITRVLYIAAFVGSRRDPRLKAYRQKLIAAGKPTKVAIIACARKLLTILTAMTRDKTDYRVKLAA